MKWKLLALFLVVSSELSCRPCQSGSDEEIAECLALGPIEDLKMVPELDRFLSKHKVYVSITSSPKRISKLPLVLKTIDLNLVEKIFVSLPEKYRDEQDYVIPDELHKFPKVEILQGGKDLGPIMKLLPAVRRVQEAGDREAIVITVDDDTGYAIGVFSNLVKNAVVYRAVVASIGANVDLWKIDEMKWPFNAPRFPDCYSGYELSYCDVVEGYGAVAYPVHLVDVEKLKTLSQLSKACRTSDDIVISYGLAMDKVPTAVVATRYFPDSRQIIQFEYGFEEDALHRGSGYLDTLVDTSTNSARYQACVSDMNAWAMSAAGKSSPKKR